MIYNLISLLYSLTKLSPLDSSLLYPPCPISFRWTPLESNSRNIVREACEETKRKSKRDSRLGPAQNLNNTKLGRRREKNATKRNTYAKNVFDTNKWNKSHQKRQRSFNQNMVLLETELLIKLILFAWKAISTSQSSLPWNKGAVSSRVHF